MTTAGNPTQWLVFRVGPVACAVSALAVDHIGVPPAHVTGVPGATAADPGLIPAGGEVAAVIDMHRRFGLPAPEAGRGRLLLTHLNGIAYGFWVDEVVGLVDAGQARTAPLPADLPRAVFGGVLLHGAELVLTTDFARLRAMRPDPELAAALRRLSDRDSGDTPSPGEPTAHAPDAPPPPPACPDERPEQASIPAAATPPRDAPPVTREKPTPAPATERPAPHAARPAARTTTARIERKPAGSEPPLPRPARPSPPSTRLTAAAPTRPSPAGERPWTAAPTETADPPPPAARTPEPAAPPRGGAGWWWALTLLPLAGLVVYALQPIPSTLPKGTVAPPPPAVMAESPLTAPARIAPEPASEPIPKPASEAPLPRPQTAAPPASVEKQPDGVHIVIGREAMRPDIKVVDPAPESTTETTSEQVAAEPAVATAAAPGATDLPTAAEPTVEPASLAPLAPAPAARKAEAEPAGSCTRRGAHCVVVHVVVRGDTLWDIAARYIENPWRYPELAALSNVADPDLIFPGQRIYIVFQ